MTRLYTRLVTYNKLYSLRLVLLLSWYQLYIVHNFVLDIDYSVIFYFSLSCCFCLHCYYARTPFPLHTHLLRRFWWPWIRTSKIFGHLLILFRCSCDRTRYEKLESLFFLIIGILALLFMLFSDSIFIVSSCHFFSLFICYYCVRYLCHIAVILIYRSRFCSLFRLL